MVCTTATKKYRIVRWLSAQVAARLAEGIGAFLEIEDERGCTPYRLDPVIQGDEVVAWTLMKPETDAEGFEVPVTYTLPADLSGCQCPQSAFRPNGNPCRHRASLRAAFAKIGYVP